MVNVRLFVFAAGPNIHTEYCGPRTRITIVLSWWFVTPDWGHEVRYLWIRARCDCDWNTERCARGELTTPCPLDVVLNLMPQEAWTCLWPSDDWCGWDQWYLERPASSSDAWCGLDTDASRGLGGHCVLWWLITGVALARDKEFKGQCLYLLMLKQFWGVLKERAGNIVWVNVWPMTTSNCAAPSLLMASDCDLVGVGCWGATGLQRQGQSGSGKSWVETWSSDWSTVITWPGYWPLIGQPGAGYLMTILAGMLRQGENILIAMTKN